MEVSDRNLWMSVLVGVLLFAVVVMGWLLVRYNSATEKEVVVNDSIRNEQVEYRDTEVELNLDEASDILQKNLPEGVKQYELKAMLMEPVYFDGEWMTYHLQIDSGGVDSADIYIREWPMWRSGVPYFYIQTENESDGTENAQKFSYVPEEKAVDFYKDKSGKIFNIRFFASVSEDKMINYISTLSMEEWCDDVCIKRLEVYKAVQDKVASFVGSMLSDKPVMSGEVIVPIVSLIEIYE